MDVITRIYRETKELYADLRLEHDPGYEILLGPAFHHAPILFIGYQPGYGTLTAQQCRKAGYEDRPPIDFELNTADWRLAAIMQNMFGRNLNGCVATNAIFVRDASISDYTNQVPKHTRTQIFDFCFERLIRIIECVKPTKIVAIGLGTLRLFGATEAILHSAKGRLLMEKGAIGGYTATSTLHLSGARISFADRADIAARILSIDNRCCRVEI